MAIGTRTTEPPATPEFFCADRVYRLSVDQYQRMARAGILDGRDRLELLEGRLVTKMTKNPPHVLAAKRANDALRAAVPAGWHVSKEDPVATIDSVPEPDGMVVLGAPGDYGDRLPHPRDVALVVEVADSSLKLDQTVMKVIYARAAIPVYWIVNIPARRLEVYTDPTGPADAPDYRLRHDYGPDDDVPLVLDGREVARIPVRDLLP